MPRQGDLFGLDFIRDIVRRISTAPGGGFLLDHPAGAHHQRNLPFSWADGKMLFGWGPAATLRVGARDAPRKALSKLGNFLSKLDTGTAAIAVGYLSYDLGGYLEPTCASRRPPDAMPLVSFSLYDEYFEYDPPSGGLWRCRAGGVRQAMMPSLVGGGGPMSSIENAPAAKAIAARPNFTPDEYRRAVAAARDYILAGDIFEVNLSQRFRGAFDGDAGELYMRLREHNPAPYAAFLRLSEGAVLSSSPELFLRVRGDTVVTRPIKGTIRRERDAQKDLEAAERLRLSDKDNAELAMIIDLERNDLGRVCRYATVRVPERARVESFSRVHHLVSTIEGRLVEGAGLCDLLKATFPGGSITGAPKVRAMQIIDELEPCRRGVYTGSVGYVLPGGIAEFNIAIRTLVCAEGSINLQVGGAVTAESDPHSEYEETLAKAEAMLEALSYEAPVATE